MSENNMNHPSLKENAYRLIKDKLLNLEIVPGSRIREDFIAEEISADTYVSLMSQYFPAHKAVFMPPMNRRIGRLEYEKAKEWLEAFGLERGWVQG